MSRRLWGCGAFLAGLAILSAPAASETAEEFFRGKQIQLVIGYNPGGPYDIYSRLAATLLPKYIPGNPRIVPQNMAHQADGQRRPQPRVGPDLRDSDECWRHADLEDRKTTGSIVLAV